MKKLFALLLSIGYIFVFSTSVVFSQNAKTTATPPTDKDDVVRISTNLIQIDVTVTDKSGKIITDLKPEEFEIYENGEKQDISNFSFISTTDPNLTRQPAVKNGKNLAYLPPSTLRPEQVKRTIALVVDDLNMSFESIYFVRQAMRKFVEEQMQEGDLVAIIRTGGGVGALQQFSYDKRQLLAAIDKIHLNLSGSGRISTFAPIQAAAEDETRRTNYLGDGDVDNYREDIFAVGTLGAINYVIRGMKELPGRKSVMLFSDGLELFSTIRGNSRQPTRILNALRRLTDLANRAAVVVYTMDAKGLDVPMLSAEDNTYGVSGDEIGDEIENRRQQIFNSQEGLIYLAKQTGGFALVNQNDLNKGIRRMLEDQKGYYLVGYQPDSDTFDPRNRRYNKLIVKVKREGVRVRFRSGFFGITDEQAVPKNLTEQQQFYAALTSPFVANQVDLRLSTVFGSDEKKGSFVNSFLHVDANDLKFEKQADGTYKTVLDVVAMSFGDNGIAVDELARTYTLVLPEDSYRHVLETGFVYRFAFPIKKPGAYQFRVVLRDRATAKIGTANQFIEVPNLKKDRLTLSGIVLENFTGEQWQAFIKTSASQEKGAVGDKTDPMIATSLRRFKRGTVLRYGYEIYNAKSGTTANTAQITTKVRVFRDGEIVFDGKELPLNTANQSDLQRIFANGYLNLNNRTQPGDYILQVIVTDHQAKEKNRTTMQFLPFEIVE